MKELQVIQAKMHCPKGNRNQFGGYNYRSCADILEAVKPLLAETNTTLTLTDDLVQVGDRYYVKATATIYNEAGAGVCVSAFAREALDKKGMDASQITGSASSYARKYALSGLFAIDDTADDDTRQPTDIKPEPKAQPTADDDELATALHDVRNAMTLAELTNVWKQYADAYADDIRFVGEVKNRKQLLTAKG